MESPKIYVAFHIGRGGRFNNANYRTFIGQMTFAELVQMRSQYLFEENRDRTSGKFCKPYLHDGNGNFVTDDNYKDGLTGTLEFDTIYDTDYVKSVEDCEDFELQKIIDSKQYITDELTNYIESRNIETN